MAGIRTCDRESQVQRPNHYTTEPPVSKCMLYFAVAHLFLVTEVVDAKDK